MSLSFISSVLLRMKVSEFTFHYSQTSVFILICGGSKSGQKNFLKNFKKIFLCAQFNSQKKDRARGSYRRGGCRPGCGVFASCRGSVLCTRCRSDSCRSRNGSPRKKADRRRILFCGNDADVVSGNDREVHSAVFVYQCAYICADRTGDKFT